MHREGENAGAEGGGFWAKPFLIVRESGLEMHRSAIVDHRGDALCFQGSL